MSKRSASRMEIDAEADAAVSSTDAFENSKRMRLRGGRDAPSPQELEDDEEAQGSADELEFLAEDDGDTPPPRANGRGPAYASTASANEYSPGAIVRVTLENFVTYSKADFFPGPSLNMVIGPNGTGKSSLVCAMCLGLGYQPSVLGRADKVGQYVKHGNTHAIVEIELQKRRKDKANYVIKLRIDAESNARTFWLNGRECTLKHIKKVMRALRIQIDNLCQFLPQDKVVEFSGMEPIELLNKTLSAAAPEELVEQQQQLKQMFSEQKALRRELDTGTETLRSLENRQQNVQADVERLKEREQVQKSVDDLVDARKVVYYNEQRKQHNELKEQRKKAEKKRTRLERENQPALEEVNAKLIYKNAVDRVLQARRTHAEAEEAKAEKDMQAIEKAKDEIRTLESNKKLERDSMDKKKKEVGQYRNKITQLEGQLESMKDIETRFNAKEWNHKIRECESRGRELKAQQQELNGTRSEVVARGRAKNLETKDIRQEIASLDSQEGQKLAQLRGQDADVAKAYDWLQQHQNEFEKEVFGPALLTCSMKDKRFSNLVQSGLQRDDLFCFTAQTKPDHQKLTAQFYGKMNFAVSIRTILTDLSDFRPPVPKEAIANMGLDGFAMDFIEGPRPVLAMLCSEKKLHLTGVSLTDISDAQYQRLFDGEKINLFAAGTTYYRITRRREYGPGATSTITKRIQPGRWWTDEPMDMSAKADLERRLEERQLEVAEIKEEYEGVNAKLAELGEKIQEVETEQVKLQEDKATLQQEHSKYRKLPDEIDKAKKSLQRVRDDLEATRERMLSHDDQIDQVALEQAKLVLQHSRRLSLLRVANQAVLEAQTRQLEAASDLEALKERSLGIAQMLEDESRKVEQLSDEVKKVKEVAQRAQQEAMKPLTDADGQIDEERKARILQLADEKTMDSITGDIDAEQARLELIHDTDPGLLRDFEERARRIARGRADMATKQASFAELEDSIQEVKQVWEPALDDIIRRINDAFSYNFEQINCAGEVGVHKDEDFDKWSIEIKVKFRENESLQHLDKHRQSGGERSVSTIFYLMSLQAMAQAPFRVVDEINQGMDPRNERMVHERMVDIACHEHTSQYFLITPKLLGGLRYDERMRILCIASGEHMPVEGRKLDFTKVLKIKKKLIAAAGA